MCSAELISPLQNLVKADLPPPRTSTGLKDLVEDLMDATPLEDRVDTDFDGLFDKVEFVIGTDFNNTDSDFDRLDDYYEVQIDSDPLDPDTNNDGLVDYLEVLNTTSHDLDGDGITNVWDYDNDGDGVSDEVDLSPFSKSILSDKFNFNVKINGRPTYINLQFRPRDPEHLKLYTQFWDWPYDAEGLMKDLDGSLEDVKVVPQLNVTVNVPPDQKDVEELGILVTDYGVHVPVFPVWENDDIVAFSAQIFYNASTPLTLEMDAQLIWRVLGNTDKEAKAVQAYNERYVSVGSDGKLAANASEITVLETFQWLEAGENKVVLKAYGGSYLSVADDGSIVALESEIGVANTFELVDKGDNMVCLKAYNGMYIYVNADGALVANSSTTENLETLFRVVDRGCLNDWTILVTYQEPFTLTGFTASQSWGCDLGLFYNEDKSQTARANVLLDYDFLTNSTTHLQDMHSILAGYGVNIISNVTSFTISDEAFTHMSNNMLPDVLDSLPPNQTLPVIIGVEERSMMIEMSQLISNSYILGSSYFIDFSIGIEPLITTKTLKTNFYETTGYKALEIEEIMRDIAGWQLSDEERIRLSSMVLVWNTGEQVVSRMGSYEVDYQPPEEAIWAEETLEATLDGIEFLLSVGQGVWAYRALTFLESKGMISLLRLGGKTGGFRLLTKMISQMSKAKYGIVGAYGMKGLSTFNKVMRNLAVLGAMLDVGMSIYTAVIFADQIGGHIGKEIAAAFGIAATTYAILYATILFAIGEIPVAGPIIVLVIVLADIFGGFSEKVMDWLIDFFSPDVYGTVEPGDLEIGVPGVTIDDKDLNGLDVGDRISITLNTTGRVEGSRLENVEASWYRPYISIRAAPGSFSNKSETGIPDSSTWETKRALSFRLTNATHAFDFTMNLNTGEITPFNPLDPPLANVTLDPFSFGYWKTETYETGAWIEPGISMPNFPVSVQLNVDYRLCYTVSGLFGWSEETRSNQGFDSSGLFTLYYDVFPETIDAFCEWRGITPLDHDYDGLNDDEEDGSNPFAYDTDADGLNDKYEVELGLDPCKFDTDLDGLLDWFELNFNTNATDKDTDGDGLPDYQELSGYLIKFNYAADPDQQFMMRVFSDPRIPDTDGDGIDDYIEYLSGLNPKSGDTNGDGIGDVAAPRFENTYIEFVKDTEIIMDAAGLWDIAVDENGYIYVSGQGREWTFDPELSLVSAQNFTTIGYEGEICNSIVIDDKNGFIHFSNIAYPFFGILTFNINGTQIGGQVGSPWGYKNFTYIEQYLDVDSDGNVYATRENYIDVYDLNRTLMKTWGSRGPEIDKFIEIRDIAVDNKYGRIYVVDNGHPDQDRVAVFDKDGNYEGSINGFDNGTLSIPFNNPTGVDVDSDGCVYIVDSGNYRVHKFDPNGVPLLSWGGQGSGEGEFELPPDRIAVDSEGNIYITETKRHVEEIIVSKIHKFAQMPTSSTLDEMPDRDGDGLINAVEIDGWNAIFTNITGTFAVHVTSDPLLNDTDFDGLSDYTEFVRNLDPRVPDTDSDGVSDFAECNWHHSSKMNPAHCDTDGDGFDDGSELTYGSDPTKQDTDFDGLSDLEEFLLNSDPNDADTDDDGLSDYQETLFNSNITNPDSDSDFMFDGAELSHGTNPRNGDTDSDGLLDGHEIVFETNPLDSDSDDDKLPDGFEIDNWLNPVSNDTDGDGLSDSDELEKGTNPRNEDSDFDGIPDGEDVDSNSTHVANLVLAFDPDAATNEFADKLAQYTNVTIVSKEELLANYTNSPYIVLVGRPNGDGAIGNLIHDILLDSGTVLTNMMESDVSRFAVRYGLWSNPQTVVTLSTPYPSDHLKVLDILGRKIITILPDSAIIQFNMSLAVRYSEGDLMNQTNLSSFFLSIAEIDTVKVTDAIVLAILEEDAKVTVQLTRYNETTVPFPLTHPSGLEPYEQPVGRYLEISPSGNVQNATSDLIDSAVLRLYYKESDLDKTGNGFGGDPGDIDEDTLMPYFFNENSSKWIKAGADLPWVLDFGVNTTDIDLYGEIYAGYVWATVSHFSLYGIVGLPFNHPPDVTNAHPSTEYLWPPNKKLTPITVEGVTDPDGDTVTIKITSITSNELITPQDAYGVETDTAWLRADRLGKGEGRVYVIEFIASDSKGSETASNVSVFVPHDMGKQTM